MSAKKREGRGLSHSSFSPQAPGFHARQKFHGEYAESSLYLSVFDSGLRRREEQNATFCIVPVFLIPTDLEES